MAFMAEVDFMVIGVVALLGGQLLTLLLGWTGVATPMEGARAGGLIGLVLVLLFLLSEGGLPKDSNVSELVLFSLIVAVILGIICAAVAKVIGGTFRSEAQQ